MKCLKCENEFEIKGNRKKFCSEKCRQRYYSLKQYNKVKDTKEYKEKRREYFRKWLDNNREHFNDLVREHNKLAQRKRRAELKEKNEIQK